MKRVKTRIPVVVWSVLVFCIAGCTDKFLDPTQIGRFRPTPAVNVILDTLGVAEETPVAWEQAEEPRPGDIVAVQTDYVLSPGDTVRISIFELFQQGMSVVGDYMVSETGKISIPDVGVVQAAGLTETQLEEEIRQILSPGVLKEPSVTVILLSSQQRTFSVLGDGVPAPGRYVIPRYDFRLTDALATAGGPRQFNVSYVYVSRSVKDKAKAAEPVKSRTTEPRRPELKTVEPEIPDVEPGSQVPTPGAGGPVSIKNGITKPKGSAARSELEREMLETVSPSALRRWPASEKVINGSWQATGQERFAAEVPPKGFERLVPRTRSDQYAKEILQSAVELGSAESDDKAGNATEAEGRVEWIFQDGKWIPVRIGASEVTPQVPEAQRLDSGIDWVFKDGKWIPTQVVSAKVAPQAGEAERADSGINWIFKDGKWIPVQTAAAEVAPQPVEAGRAESRINWVFKDGRWVPVQAGQPTLKTPAIKFEPEGPAVPLDKEEKLPMEIEWDEATQTRLLKIPADKLLAGDPRYNIVIKPGDTIHVPVDIIGEFCIMGNVNHNGFVNITGRPMTLKMAIAAAGGLGPLAWPKSCEVIRRIGEKREETVMVDLDKIAAGEQPDFFIKPNDLVNVGTHPSARWRAVLRNAFRATYGFGFVYDRNFADADYGEGFRLPHWL